MTLLSTAQVPTSFATAKLTLIAAADRRSNRFAICDVAGNPVWQKAFSADKRNRDQPWSDLAAAKLAVWVAHAAKALVGADTIHLTLKVDAQWLVWANEVASGGKKGGKARELGECAQKLNVKLTVEHIPEIANPAHQYALGGGSKEWFDNDWNALVS